ncbi:Vitamin K epoxide reductase [Rhodococcus hoagii]|nr:Vitamin K epoxide reductase [Prescottella equi]
MHSMQPSAEQASSAPSSRSDLSFTRALPWLLLIGGLIGLVSSSVLTVEKIRLLTDPAYVPSCSLNPVLSCGSVMSVEQASVFGFPNSLLGIAGFAVVAATGAGMLAGARFARWYWLAMQTGVTAAAAFVHWLIFQSLYMIGALCPYCMVVWAVTVPIFWYVTLRNLHHGTFTRPIQSDAVTAAGNHLLLVTAWFLAVAALILHRFYSYWSGLL